VQRRRLLVLAVVAVVAVVALAGGAIAWYLRDDAPARVSIGEDQAAPRVGEAAGSTEPAADGATTTSASPATSTSAAARPSAPSAAGGAAVGEGVDGTWQLAPGQESFVGFRIDEELTGIGANTVVGRTPAVTASFELADGTVSATTVEADVTLLTTDSDRRDNALRTLGLETDRFPTVTFGQTGPVQLSAVPDVGDTVSATIPGELTLHGVTRPIEVPVQAELREPNLIKVVGTQTIAITDHGMTKPVIGPVLSVADSGELELQLFFAR
jgi:polyisoprenoid-binding protein YceI